MPLWKLCSGWCGCCCTVSYAVVGVAVFYIHHYSFFPGFALEDSGWRPRGSKEFSFASGMDGASLRGVVSKILDCGVEEPETCSSAREKRAPVLFFGGNGCLMDSSASIAEEVLPALLDVADTGGGVGLDYFVSSYRGYEPNDGWTSREALAADAEALRDYATSNGRVVLVGWSLGTAVALQLAAASPQRVAGVLLLAPFTSMAEETDAFIKNNAGTLACVALLPWRWCMNLDPWDSRAAVASLPADVPLAVVSPGNDEMIPTWQHLAIFDASQAGVKTFLRAPGACHGCFQKMTGAFGGSGGEGGLADWLRATLARASWTSPWDD